MIERILVDDVSNPEIVWLRFSTSPWWHRTFIDEGVVFWEERDERASFEDFPSQPSSPTGARPLIGSRVQSITCGGDPIEVVVAADAGALVLDVLSDDSFRVVIRAT